MNQQDLESKVRTASNKMRADDNTKVATKYMEHISWLLFLKVHETVEDELDLIARADGSRFDRAIESPYRWSEWTTAGLTGKDLVDFVTDELLPYLRGLTGGAASAHIAKVFNGVTTVMKSGYVLAEVIAEINKVEFEASSEFHPLSVIYESLLAQMGKDAGWSGEFYTPRSIVEFIVDLVGPRLGETVYDPATGSGGFLVAAFEALSRQIATTPDREALMDDLRGRESGELPFLLGTMNLILHGVITPNLERGNTLELNVRRIGPDDQSDVILTNPPFGGRENPQVQQNFYLPSAATEALFLQHIMASLRLGGRAGFVVPEGLLFEESYGTLRSRLLRDFDVHSIVRLPDGAFAPYSDVQTNLVFLSRPGPTRSVWFYEVAAPVGKKRFTKTRPVRPDDLSECRELFHHRSVSPRSWLVGVEELDDASRLALANPNKTVNSLGVGTSAARGLATASLARASEAADRALSGLDKIARSEEWKPIAIGQLCRRVKRPIDISDDEVYTQLTIQMWGRGAKLRHEQPGQLIKTKRQFLTREGDVVVSRIDARNGAVAVIPGEFDGAIVSGDFWTLEPQENVLADLLHLLLTSQPGVDLMTTASRGATNRKRLNEDEFFKATLPFPPDVSTQSNVLAAFEDLATAAAASAELAQALGVVRDATRNELLEID